MGSSAWKSAASASTIMLRRTKRGACRSRAEGRGVGADQRPGAWLVSADRRRARVRDMRSLGCKVRVELQ
jgi:hypothetical protein